MKRRLAALAVIVLSLPLTAVAACVNNSNIDSGTIVDMNRTKKGLCHLQLKGADTYWVTILVPEAGPSAPAKSQPIPPDADHGSFICLAAVLGDQFTRGRDSISVTLTYTRTRSLPKRGSNRCVITHQYRPNPFHETGLTMAYGYPKKDPCGTPPYGQEELMRDPYSANIAMG